MINRGLFSFEELKQFPELLVQYIEAEHRRLIIQTSSGDIFQICPTVEIINSAINQQTSANVSELESQKITDNDFYSNLKLTHLFYFKGFDFTIVYGFIDKNGETANSEQLQTELNKIVPVLQFFIQSTVNEHLLLSEKENHDADIYHQAVLQSHNAIAFADLNGIITKANDAWVKMHGYNNLDEIIGRPLHIFHTKKQIEEQVNIQLKSSLELGRSTAEIGHIDKQGKEIHTLMTTIRVKNNQKEPIGFVGIATDITELKLFQERLLSILESVAFGIMLIDPYTFEIIELNKTAIKYIGTEKKNIVGKRCYNFTCPAEKGKCPVKDLDLKVNNSERILLTARGERIPILKTVNEVYLNDRKVLIESFIDIRDQKRAQQLAEESVKLKTAFLSNISHEIRTPLNHILGFTSLVLEDDTISDTYKEYLGIVKRSGNNLLRIIEDIVTISKIEAGHHNVSENNFHINQLLYAIFTKYQSELVRRKKKIKLLFDNNMDLNKCHIIADEMKIRQVIENLVSNAIKYTEAGFVSMGISINEKTIDIIIQDSGQGIAEENLALIFESFRQFNTTSRKIYEGIGIGLSICKSLSNMIGGDIKVESVLGKGSKFTFTFPYNTADEREQAAEELDVKTPALTGKTIMIVEDEKINYLYLKTLLQSTQAHIVWKQNGSEAIEYFNNRFKVDLILMDMQMPVMDGYEATYKIRKMDPKVIIIAVTANALSDDRQKCLNLGCTEYTTKPIQQDILFWHLGHYLKN